MNNGPNAPLLPLPSTAGSRSTKKRHGWLPRSRNRKGYKHIRREAAGVNLAFETAFRHIHITEETPELPNEAAWSGQESQQHKGDVGMVVQMADCDKDNDEEPNDEVEEDLFNDDEGNVGFGSPDYGDVKERIELSLEDPDIGAEHESQDEVKQLKKDYIGKNSKTSYSYSLINFLFYIFKFDKHIMHKSWIQNLKTYDMIEDETAKELCEENGTEIVTKSWWELPTDWDVQTSTFFLSISS